MLALGGLAAWVEVRGLPRYPGEPLPPINASRDPAVIERGRYLATHVSHCPACHGPAEKVARWELGPRDDLRGGFGIPGGPFGTFFPPNLTPDEETGLGRWSDGEIARAIRTGVLKDGSVGIVMQSAVGELSDEDLTAIVSYLRAIPPIRHPVPKDQLGFLAKAMGGMFHPRRGERPADAPGPSVERGAYLAKGPAICIGCHTDRDPLRDFALTSPPFAGRSEATVHRDHEGYEFAPPNLTPDPRTGRIAGWTEEQFVQRFRAGRVLPGSPMPWESFSGMSDDDLKSLYRYLKSLPPVERDVGPSYRKRGWKAG